MNTHFRPTIRSPGYSSECIQNRIQLSSISILHIAVEFHLHVLTWSVPTPFWSRWPERSLLLCVCARSRQFWILQPWVLFGISKNSWEEAMQQNGATQCRASPTIFLAAENGKHRGESFFCLSNVSCTYKSANILRMLSMWSFPRVRLLSCSFHFVLYIPRMKDVMTIWG